MSQAGRLLEWHLEALSVCHTFLGIRARGGWIRGIKSRPTKVPCPTLTNRPNKTPEYRSQNRIRAEKTCLYMVSDVLMSCMQWFRHLETVDHPKMGDNCGAKVQWQHSSAHALSSSYERIRLFMRLPGSCHSVLFLDLLRKLGNKRHDNTSEHTNILTLAHVHYYLFRL